MADMIIDGQILNALQCLSKTQAKILMFTKDPFGEFEELKIKDIADLINSLKSENEKLWLCVDELKREVGRHERNYDPDENTERIIKNIMGENYKNHIVNRVKPNN